MSQDPRRSLEQCLEALRAGDVSRAEGLCKRVLANAPKHPDALHLLGCARLAQRRVADALRLIGQAVDAAPSVPMFHENLAEALFQSGEHERARAECELALRLDPTLHRPHNLLGRIAMERGEHEDAIAHLLSALEARSPYLDALVNLGAVLNRTGDHALAMDYSRLALRVAPGHPGALVNLGLAHRARGEHDEARAAFEAAGPDPRARFDLGYLHLLRDDLARGLPLLEERKRLLGVGSGMTCPEWGGVATEADADAGRTLLVLHEQGLGDTLLMARFLPALCDRFARVIAHVQPPLARLIAGVDPRLEVVTSREGTRADRWVATMSLPHALGLTRLEQVPLAPWLHAAPTLPPSDRPRVGLNWAGNPRYAFDAIRSTHLADLALLLQVGDVEWVSLHRGHLEHEAEAFGLPQPLREATDLLDTAGVVASCDLVISTETAVPNLSAALGVPTCVLTSPDPDWRWSSWYAGVTVCRQSDPGDWSQPLVGALEAVRDLLVRRLAA